MDYYAEYVGVPHKPMMATAPPMRNQNAERQPSICNRYLYLMSLCLLLRAILTCGLVSMLYSVDIQNKVLTAIAFFDVCTAASILLMCCAVKMTQPYLLIPFVVLRTMELFVWLCVVIGFGFALFDTRSEYFITVYQLVKIAAQKLPIHNVELMDLTYQVCAAGIFSAAMALAVTTESTRHAWVTVIRVTDESKLKCRSSDLERRRIMVASDELYTNY